MPGQLPKPLGPPKAESKPEATKEELVHTRHSITVGFLLHRPMSRSRIFLGKVLAGVSLYLLALGICFACAVGLAATSGHVAAPFSWPMVLPLLADIFAGLVYYFAGMLTAQREARWYGSRCLGLGAAFGCSMVVWTVPKFWHALLAILCMAGRRTPEQIQCLLRKADHDLAKDLTVADLCRQAFSAISGPPAAR
jgi:hypothetical protein